jgi:hypothetical protein
MTGGQRRATRSKRPQRKAFCSKPAARAIPFPELSLGRFAADPFPGGERAAFTTFDHAKIDMEAGAKIKSRRSATARADMDSDFNLRRQAAGPIEAGD